MDDKAVVVSQSYLLHHNEQYKMVFIAPDKTKLEQEKHKGLIAELKERRSSVWIKSCKPIPVKE